MPVPAVAFTVTSMTQSTAGNAVNVWNQNQNQNQNRSQNRSHDAHDRLVLLNLPTPSSRSLTFSNLVWMGFLFTNSPMLCLNQFMWVWSKLSGVQWMDAWEDRFYGNPNAVITRLKTHKTIRVEVYTETEEQALEIKKLFGGSIRKLVHKNWAAVTEPARPPIRIRSSVIITGSRDDGAREKLGKQFPGRHIIQIPADMAFGTGDHATTSTCMRLLVDVAKERAGTDWDMLDLGTGSGVIAIAARMLGAHHCLGMDFDPQAIKVARRNVRRNHVSLVTMTEADVLQWKPERQWPVVIANLFSTILQQAFPTITKALEKNGDIIVSGILYDQWEDTRAIAEQCGLSFSQIKRKGKWMTARGIRIK